MCVQQLQCSRRCRAAHCSLPGVSPALVLLQQPSKNSCLVLRHAQCHSYLKEQDTEGKAPGCYRRATVCLSSFPSTSFSEVSKNRSGCLCPHCLLEICHNPWNLIGTCPSKGCDVRIACLSLHQKGKPPCCPDWQCSLSRPSPGPAEPGALHVIPSSKQASEVCFSPVPLVF